MEVGKAERFLRWQFALDGLWEEALHLRPGERGGKDRFLSWLEKARRDVAVELFFETEEGEMFLGLRFPPERDVQRRLAMALLDLDRPGPSLAVSLAALRVFPGLEGLFEGGPDFMELGVVNAWKSFGPLRFWEGSSSSPLEAFRGRLDSEEERRYRGPLPLPLALEAAFSSPWPHWMGFPVSSPSPEGHRLDPAKAEKVLARWAPVTRRRPR